MPGRPGTAPAAHDSEGGGPSPGFGRSGWPTAVSNFAERHRWRILVVWVLLLGIGAVSAASVTGTLRSGGWDVAGSGTVAVRELLAEGLHGRGATTAVLVVHDRENTADSPAFDQRTREAFEQVRSDPRLRVQSSFGWSTLSPLARGAFLGKDRATVVTSIGSGLGDDEATKVLPAIQKDLVDRFESRGLDVSLVNVQAYQGAINEDSAISMIRAEAIALPLVALVLLLLFRSVVAVCAAMAATLTVVIFGLGIVGAVARHVELSIFVQNVVLMLGIGVGVDYSLIMIKRFKEELAAGQPVRTAVPITLATAGHTVIVSGVTIVVGATALYVVPLNAIVSIAAGAALVVALGVLVCIVLMPVLLHLLGDRINRGAVRLPARLGGTESASDAELAENRWYRTALGVMRRPVISLTAGAAVLVLLAIPALNMSLSVPDPRMLPASSPVRTGFEYAADQFGPGATLPIQVVVSTPAPLADPVVADELTRFVDDVAALPNVQTVNSAMTVLRQVSPTNPFAALQPAAFDRLPSDAQQGVRYFVPADGHLFVAEIVTAQPPADPATRELLGKVVDRAGQLPPPLTADVGGQTSRAEDVNQVIADKLVLVLVLMLAAVYIVLLLSFRSVFLPLKAIAMNLLSVGAIFGVLVMIFQYGWLHDGVFDHSGYLVSFVPPLVLAMIIGLSTDYEVFLLNRVREEYLASGDNQLAVARGMARTAPLITGAAILMIVVFGAFGLAGNMIMQQMGIGLAVAVALDATLVRIVIVPAVMKLLGRWNWWPSGRP
ncbi:MMPL family transporter [Nocardia transvalensis]|uniref:MMPL family transporter n=1 Tax=Nocardia transvalensis TaxID=37333 RepID=UPI001893CE8C|nr:MMPL family transporter [Nocardia transvalensis]MBF6331945.1 MMPL family transporter [Nocardia transvalensis]